MSDPNFADSATLGWATLSLTIVATILGTIFYLIQKGRQPRYVTIQGQVKRLPPGPVLGKYYLPVIGETIHLILSPFNFLDYHIQSYGPVSYTKAFGHETVIFEGADALKHFYNEDLIQRNGAYPLHYIRMLGGHVSSTLDGPVHQERRLILENALKHGKVVPGHVKKFELLVDKHFQRWGQLNHFNWVNELQHLCADAASSILFGTEEGHIFVDHMRNVMRGFTSFPVDLPFTNYGKAMASRKKLFAWYNKQVEQHVNCGDYETEGSAKEDALGAMLRERKHTNVTMYEIQMELHYLVLSFYSLFNVLSGCIVAMTEHPEMRQRLKEEVQGEKPQEEPVNLERMYQLPYLNLFLNEVKRYFPLVPGVYGKVKQSFDLHGYHIPKGWCAIASLYATNHSQSLYSDPDKFNPERFDNEPAVGMTYGLVPQGGGSKHRCVGEDLTNYMSATFLLKLLHHCNWEITVPAGDTAFKPLLEFNKHLFVPEPLHGLHVNRFSYNPTLAYGV